MQLKTSMRATRDFQKNNDLGNHVESKHNEDTLRCCNNIFGRTQYLAKHHHEYLDIGFKSYLYLI